MGEEARHVRKGKKKQRGKVGRGLGSSAQKDKRRRDKRKEEHEGNGERTGRGLRCTNGGGKRGKATQEEE